MVSSEGSRRFLTRGEVARRFGVSENTVTLWAKAGKLPYVVTPGGQHRYPRQEIESLVKALHHPERVTER